MMLTVVSETEKSSHVTLANQNNVGVFDIRGVVHSEFVEQGSTVNQIFRDSEKISGSYAPKKTTSLGRLDFASQLPALIILSTHLSSRHAIFRCF